MHELAIAKNIVEIVNQHVPAGGTRAVRTVRLKIGELAGVVLESLEFCFRSITSGTLLEDAQLEIEQTPLVVFCIGCSTESRIEQPLFLCPLCGNGNVDVRSGMELHVAEIELVDNVTETP